MFVWKTSHAVHPVCPIQCFARLFSLSEGLGLDVYLQSLFLTAHLLTTHTLPSLWVDSLPRLHRLPRSSCLCTSTFIACILYSSRDSSPSATHTNPCLIMTAQWSFPHLVCCVGMAAIRDGRMLEVWFRRVDAVRAVGCACQGWRQKQVSLVLEKPFDVFKSSVPHL